MIPGLHYVEMARMAGEVATGKPVMAVSNLVWGAPKVIAKSAPSHAVSLRLHGSVERLAYSVHQEGNLNQANHIGRLGVMSSLDPLPQANMTSLLSGLETVTNVPPNIETVSGDGNVLSIKALYRSRGMVLAKVMWSGTISDGIAATASLTLLTTTARR